MYIPCGDTLKNFFFNNYVGVFGFDSGSGCDGVCGYDSGSGYDVVCGYDSGSGYDSAGGYDTGSASGYVVVVALILVVV